MGVRRTECFHGAKLAMAERANKSPVHRLPSTVIPSGAGVSLAQRAGRFEEATSKEPEMLKARVEM